MIYINKTVCLYEKIKNKIVKCDLIKAEIKFEITLFY